MQATLVLGSEERAEEFYLEQGWADRSAAANAYWVGSKVVAASVDGFKLPIKIPKGHAAAQFYQARDGPDISMCVLVSSDGIVRGYSGGEGVRSGDSPKWIKSGMYEDLADGVFPFDGPFAVHGDQAYARRLRTLKMVPPVRVLPQVDNVTFVMFMMFNRCINASRQVVERAIGTVQRRFPTLAKVPLHPDRKRRQFFACVFVHNFIVWCQHDTDAEPALAIKQRQQAYAHAETVALKPIAEGGLDSPAAIQAAIGMYNTVQVVKAVTEKMGDQMGVLNSRVDFLTAFSPADLPAVRTGTAVVAKEKELAAAAGGGLTNAQMRAMAQQAYEWCRDNGAAPAVPEHAVDVGEVAEVPDEGLDDGVWGHLPVNEAAEAAGEADEDGDGDAPPGSDGDASDDDDGNAAV